MPFWGRFHHSRAELIADGLVHAIGLVLAVAAGATLLAFAAGLAGPGEYMAAIFYVVSLLTVLSVSFLYNMWPIGPTKWVLRRFDHAAIYLLIAGTYTPFLMQLDGPEARVLTVLVWAAALVGMSIKILLPGRFDRLAVIFYLAIGWSGVALARSLVETLPTSTLALLAAGGIVYSLGVIAFVSHRLRFQSAIWHGFVVVASGLHLAAAFDCLVMTRL